MQYVSTIKDLNVRTFLIVFYLTSGIVQLLHRPPFLKLLQSLLIRQCRLQKHIHRQQRRWRSTGGMTPSAVSAKMPFSQGKQYAACYVGIRSTRVAGNVMALVENNNSLVLIAGV